MGYKGDWTTPGLHEDMFLWTLQVNKWYHVWNFGKQRILHPSILKESSNTSIFFGYICITKFWFICYCWHVNKSIQSFHLKKLTSQWADLCKSYLVEAQWYHRGHIPTLNEYLDNACVSISGPVALMHVHFLTSVSSIKEIHQCIERTENIVRYVSLIFRLTDDLGTSLVRPLINYQIYCYTSRFCYIKLHKLLFHYIFAFSLPFRRHLLTLTFSCSF